jgi:hypothetical protein
LFPLLSVPSFFNLCWGSTPGPLCMLGTSYTLNPIFNEYITRRKTFKLWEFFVFFFFPFCFWR